MPDPQALTNQQQVVARQDLEESRLYRSALYGQTFLQEVLVTAPTRGLFDSLDPASIEFHPQMAATLQNLRVATGLFQTRLGHVLWTTLPSSGYVHYLNNYYENLQAYRIAARGGTLYYATGNGSFSAASGGTGLQQNLLHGLDLFDIHYFLDGGSYLRKFDINSTGNLVSTVTQPAQPSTPPKAQRAIWDRLVDWQGNDGAHPTGWDRSDSASIDGVIAAPGSNTVTSVGFPSDGGNDCVITY
jgi:hypothetical protein